MVNELLTSAPIRPDGVARSERKGAYERGNLLSREATAADVAQAFLHHAPALKTTAAMR